MRKIIYKPTKNETLKELIAKAETFSKENRPLFIDGDTKSICMGD